MKLGEVVVHTTLCSWLTRFCFTRFLLNTVFRNGPNSCLTRIFSPFTQFLFNISVYSSLVQILALHDFSQVTKKALTKNKVYYDCIWTCKNMLFCHFCGHKSVSDWETNWPNLILVAQKPTDGHMLCKHTDASLTLYQITVSDQETKRLDHILEAS